MKINILYKTIKSQIKVHVERLTADSYEQITKSEALFRIRVQKRN